MLSRQLEGKYSLISQSVTSCSVPAAWSNRPWLLAIYAEDLIFMDYPLNEKRQTFSTINISHVILKRWQHQEIMWEWGWQLEYSSRIIAAFQEMLFLFASACLGSCSKSMKTRAPQFAISCTATPNQETGNGWSKLGGLSVHEKLGSIVNNLPSGELQSKAFQAFWDQRHLIP